ncbi:GntR family transcriptional regulator [Salinicoccus albus]|uniref:GntR family transcriptional regulator n=1 Tax=Salinicoccus albus TaxID=418756 RepID=UPI00036800DD|nr:GntR family transcriptional regulator [Salinicoccus albus]
MIINRNISTQVVDHLRKEIILGRYQEGEPLVETSVSKELGVSRGPVREAISKLSSENLIEKFSNGRNAVVGFELEDIRNLYDTRILLENHALSQITEASYSEAREKLLHFIKQMEEADYYEQRDVETDLAFHHQLVKMSGNKSLRLLWSAQRDIFRTLIDITSEVTFTNQPEIINQHIEIVKTLDEGNVEAAQNLLKTHLSEACDHCCRGKKLI